MKSNHKIDYQSELAGLREFLSEYSHKYPELTPLLNGKGSDPDVEILVKAFAYFTTQINQRLDDEFPEFTHALFNLLFPHYLRPIPSMAILEFLPDFNQVQGKKVINKEIDVESKPVQGVKCRYKTCFDTTIYPLKIENIYLENKPNIIIRIESLNNIPIKKLDINKLSFYINGEHKWELYLALFHHKKNISIRSAKDTVQLAPECLNQVGFDEDQSTMINYPENSFGGYRLLQEYFACPDKFLFFEILNLDGLKNVDNSFEIIIELNNFPKGLANIGKESLKLNCTPVVNLFSHAADPVYLDHRKPEYKILPTATIKDHYEIYTVDKIAGFVQGTGINKNYYPFNLFGLDEHGSNSNSENIGYYNLRAKPSLTCNGADHYISFVNQNIGSLSNESISIELTCTNRQLPDDIKVGEIVNLTSSSPEYAKFRNITKPTSSLSPVVFGNNKLLFNLISHLSLNYKTLTEKQNLKEILRLYNFNAYSDRQESKCFEQQLQGIVGLSSRMTTRLFNGMPICGTEIRMSLLEDCFASEGEMYLFLSVLNEFFREYAAINSFCQLTVESVINNEVYKWAPKVGHQKLC